MIYAASDSVDGIVALASSAGQWVLVYPVGMSLAAAAAYALQRISVHIPAPIALELHDAADLAQAG